MYNQSLSKYLDQYESKLNISSLQQFELLKGLPFYNWDKPKEQQANTFVGTIGLPVKNDIVHGLYDYEKDIIEYLEKDNPADPKNRHLYILKSAGLGITTLLLYYIGWKCTTNNDWIDGRVCILTAPRLELTVDIVDRLKAIFRRNELADFDSRKTICNINNVKIEAFPSSEGHALKGMRGLTDVKMILCDEASFFDDSTINEVRDTIERYWAKTNPIIILCSTPNKPGDLMDLIRQEPENKCIYKRMYLDYTYGEDKIYTREELAFQRLSPSWGREFNLQFAGVMGNVFHTKDIEAAMERGRKLVMGSPEPTIGNSYTQKSVGLDPGFGSSNFGVCITEYVDGMINVLHAEEYSRPDFDEMIDTTIELLQKYHVTKDGSNIYCDGSNPSFIRTLKARVGEDTNYERVIDWLKTNWKKRYSLSLLRNSMLVVPVPFSTEHKKMLAHTKKVMEYGGGQVAINPKFTKLIIALRTAIENGEGALDKEETSHDDLFDAFRLALQFYQ